MTSLLSEIATMNIVRQRASIPVPRVFGFETLGPFGYPFVLMECIPGRILPSGLAKSVPVQYQPKVAEQLANVFAELHYLTFSRIGRLWCGETADQPLGTTPMAPYHSPVPLFMSLEYFYIEFQARNQLIVASHSSAERLTTAWVLKAALAHIVIDKRVRGPVPLCHLNLHFGNLLFDDEYNLVGVIDWTNAHAAPLGLLSVCPELITFPGLSEEQNRPIVEFKKLVINFLKEMENKKAEERISEEIAPPLKHQEEKIKQNEEHEDKTRISDQGSLAQDRQRLTLLSTYMASKSAKVMHHQHGAGPKRCFLAAKRIAKLIYGEHITWEQLREVYGTMPLFIA